MSDTGEQEKLRLGGMALGNGLLVHGPTHWAAAIRTRDGEIRTASGPKPTGGAPGENAHVPNQLPADVANALDVQGGADAEALGRLATLPSVGAPRKVLRAGPAVQRALAENQSIGAAVGSAASGATPALYALVVLLVGITAGLLAAAVRRARR